MSVFFWGGNPKGYGNQHTYGSQGCDSLDGGDFR